MANPAPDHRAAADSRQALLAALRGAGRPLDATEAAARAGLRPSTARTHLDLLQTAGVLERCVEGRSQRGRPRVLYRLAEAPMAPPEAVRAGRRWAASLAGPLVPGGPARPELATAIATVLELLGFRPQAGPGTGTIALHCCPYAEVAGPSRAAACSAHLGLLRGMVDELGVACTVGLEPLGRRGLGPCLVHLGTGRRSSSQPRSPGRRVVPAPGPSFVY